MSAHLPSDRQELLARVWEGLGETRADAREVADAGAPVALPAHTDVASFAWASVAAASLAAARLADGGAVDIDADRIAVAYASERHIRVNGQVPPAWAPLSGFFRCSDGWVRTHGNYPHHAAALRRSLGLPPEAGADAAAATLRVMPAAVAARIITEAAGLCVVVAPQERGADASLRERPIVRMQRIGAAPMRTRSTRLASAPLDGIRVLDLTRVIAGPVATRTLALLGADVLRIDPPDLPEPEWQHLDTGHGKRSTLLDLADGADRAVFEHLLASADVVVTGYRALALAALGLDPSNLIQRHPGLIVARLTAWGADGPTADRRGFDSLVQAATGIAWIESSELDRPGALPAQALDHSAGYLIAASVLVALRRQFTQGGSWAIDASLRRIAAELLGTARSSTTTPGALEDDPAPHLQRFDLDGLALTTAAPALSYAGGPTRFTPPRRWGLDSPEWI